MKGDNLIFPVADGTVNDLHPEKQDFFERKATRVIYLVLEETDEETINLKTRQSMVRYVESYVR